MADIDDILAASAAAAEADDLHRHAPSDAAADAHTSAAALRHDPVREHFSAPSRDGGVLMSRGGVSEESRRSYADDLGREGGRGLISSGANPVQARVGEPGAGEAARVGAKSEL